MIHVDDYPQFWWLNFPCSNGVKSPVVVVWVVVDGIVHFLADSYCPIVSQYIRPQLCPLLTQQLTIEKCLGFFLFRWFTEFKHGDFRS